MTVIKIQVPLSKAVIKEIAKEMHSLGLIEAENSKITESKVKEEEKEILTEEYFTVQQVAKKINKHPLTITRHIRLGLLIAKKTGKSWNISKTNLNKYLQNE